MTTRTTSTCAFLVAITASACGTKFIDDVESEQLASSEGGGSSGAADGPGQTVTSAAGSDGSTGGSSGVDCEPDPTAVCGPPLESQYVSLAPPSPMSGPGPEQNEFDCTVTALDYSLDVAYLSLDCGLEFPVTFNSLMPDATYQKFAVDQALHIQYTQEYTGNGNSAVISIDAHPVFIVHHGTTVDPMPGVAALGPFAVAAHDDVCLAPCVDTGSDVCYSYARQQLTFTAGDVEATVWDAGQATVTLDGSDYQIAVAVANGVVAVNPDASSCELPGYPYYSFHIADVSSP